METPKPPYSEKIAWTLSTLGCSELDLRGAAELAGRFGIRSLELRALEGRIDLAHYFAETYGTPEAFSREVRSLGVEVPVVDSSFSLLGHSPEDRQELIRLVPWAESLGCKRIRVFDGGSYSPSLSPQQLDEFQIALEWWDSERSRQGFGCDWVVETHWSLCHPQSIVGLQAILPRPVDILWDAHHTWHLSGWGMAETWAVLSPWVAHMHIKDSLRKPGASPPYELTLPGEGDFPLKALLDVLADQPHPPGVSLEWERHWVRSLPPVEEALASLCAWEGRG